MFSKLEVELLQYIRSLLGHPGKNQCLILLRTLQQPRYSTCVILSLGFWRREEMGRCSTFQQVLAFNNEDDCKWEHDLWMLEHIHRRYRGLTCCLAYAMYFRRKSTGKGLRSLSFTGSNLSLLRREEFPSKTCCKPPLACCRTAGNEFHNLIQNTGSPYTTQEGSVIYSTNGCLCVSKHWAATRIQTEGNA